MLLAARGMALVLAKDATVSVNATADWAGLSQGVLFGIPLPIFLLLAYAIGPIVLNFTRFGRHVLAVGGNEEAARLMGLPVERIKLAVYAISGVLAGLVGALFSGEAFSGLPNEGGGGGFSAPDPGVFVGTLIAGGLGLGLGCLGVVILVGLVLQIFF